MMRGACATSTLALSVTVTERKGSFQAALPTRAGALIEASGRT
jgi:hypothetical protein